MCNCDENWLVINNYPNYKISSKGRVMNSKRDIIMKLNNVGGYYQIGLTYNKIRKNFLVSFKYGRVCLLGVVPEQKQTNI